MALAKEKLEEWQRLNAEAAELGRKKKTLDDRIDQLEAEFEDELRLSAKPSIIRHGFTLAWTAGRASVSWATEFLRECGADKVQALKDAAAKSAGRKLSISAPIPASPLIRCIPRKPDANAWRLVLMVLALGLLCGCDQPLPNLQYLANREQSIPVAHLPEDYRLMNWIGTNDRGSRGGSCFWASVYMCIRQADRPDIEESLIRFRSAGFEGPEHLTSMCRKLDSIGIPWAATEDGDVELLERASQQRRWAAIGYYPGHAICFCGFYNTGQGELAILLDNNFPDQYIGVPKPIFVDSWKHAYGGMGIVPWVEPAIVNSYPRTRISYDRSQTQSPSWHADVNCIADRDNAIRYLLGADKAIDQRLGRLGQHSIGSSVAEAGSRCLRTRHWTSPGPAHRSKDYADSTGQYSAVATSRCDSLADLLAATNLRSAALRASTDSCHSSTRLLAPSLCAIRPGVSDLSELSTESVLLARLSIRRWAIRQHSGAKLWLSVDQLATVA